MSDYATWAELNLTHHVSFQIRFLVKNAPKHILIWRNAVKDSHDPNSWITLAAERFVAKCQVLKPASFSKTAHYSGTIYSLDLGIVRIESKFSKVVFACLLCICVDNF